MVAMIAQWIVNLGRQVHDITSHDFAIDRVNVLAWSEGMVKAFDDTNFLHGGIIHPKSNHATGFTIGHHAKK